MWASIFFDDSPIDHVVLLLDFCSNMLILPPLGSCTIIAPVFIDGCNLSVHYPHEGSHMTGDTSVFAIYMGCSNYMGVSGDNTLHLSIPLAGVFAVRPDKFLHGEMLVSVMPIYPSIGMEIFTDGIRILPRPYG